jgi:hypothetical protein
MGEFNNRMTKVAQILGVKLEEPFEVEIGGEPKPKHRKCKLTDDGLYEWYEDWQNWVYDPDGILHDLLTGGARVGRTKVERATH